MRQCTLPWIRNIGNPLVASCCSWWPVVPVVISSSFFTQPKRVHWQQELRSSPVHTLTCCTHIFVVYIHCAYTSHILMRVAHMHGSRVSAVRMSSSLCHLTFSFLMLHPSLLLLFFDGHFETTPDLYDLTDFDVHDFLPNFPELKAQVKRTPHEVEEFGYLALSVPYTGYEPKKFDKNTSVDDDTTLINDPDHNISDFSKTTNENTGQFCVHTVFESSVLHVSHWWFCSSERKQRKHAIGKPLLDRERGKRRFCDQCCRVDVKEKSTERFQCEYEESQRILCWRMRSLRTPGMKSSNSNSWWKFSSEKIKLDWARHGDPVFGTKKFRICIVRIATRAFESQRLQLLEDIHWTCHVQRERIHLCSEMKMKTRLHQESYARSCQNFEELKRSFNEAENTEKQQRLWEFPVQHDQESRTMSLLGNQVRRLPELLVFIEDMKFFYDPDSPSSYDNTYIPRQALITSSSRKLGREIEMLWNTREDMSIPGNVFDCQNARRDPGELHNDSRNLATLLGVLRTEGIENSGSEEPLQSILLPCSSLRAKRKSLRRQISLVSMTNHALGIWTCTQVAWQFRVNSPRRCICKTPWPNGTSKLDREFPSRSLHKSEESRARIALDWENRSSQLAEGPHQPEIKYEKRFFWLLRIGFGDGDRIEMVLRYCLFDVRNCRAWSRDKTNERKTPTPSGRLKNVFSGRQLGLVQEETLVVSHTSMTREAVRRRWDEVERRKKFSLGASILFSTESEETDWWKSLNSPKISPVTKAKNSLSMVGKMKKTSCDSRHHPVCRGYKSGNGCIYGYRCLFRHADGNEETQRKVGEGRYSRSSCYSEKRVEGEMYLKTQIQWILFYGKLEHWDWTLRRDTPWNSWDASGTKQNSGKKQAIWRHYPKRWTSWAKSFRACFWGTTPEETSRQADCDSKVARNLARKNAQFWGREIYAQIKGYFAEKLQEPYDATHRDWESAHKRGRTSFCSWFRSVRNSAITRSNASEFYWFISCAQNADIHMSGKRRNSTMTNKREDNHLYSGQHSTSRCFETVFIIQLHFVFNIENKGSVKLFQKMGLLSDTVTTRSDKHACGTPLLTDPDKQATGNREPACEHFSDEMYKEDPTQGILDWLQPFAVYLEDLEYVCSHVPLKEWTQIRKATLQKRRHKNGSTVLILTSANTERDILHERKRMVTWKQQSAKANLGTITNSLSWYKISPFSGYYPCETKTSQETEKNCTKDSWALAEAKRYLHGRFIKIWQVFWRISMESSRHCSETRKRRTSCTSSKRRDTAALLQPGLNGKWWSDSMKCFYHLRNVQNLLANGKSQYERRSGESVKGPIVLFDALISKGKKLLRWFFLVMLYSRARTWEEDILITDVEELENLASSKYVSEDWIQKKFW